MKQMILSVLLILFINQCLGQTGFPKQFQATLNISNLVWPTSTQNVQKLLYDYEHLRVRFDIQGWRAKQNETYMIKYKPEGAEADSVRRKELVIKQRLTMKLFF
jgi:hypothetical protein